MTLAKRIRDYRYAKGWGPDELASRASISRTALYQIECGKTETPRAGTLRRIAQALGIPVETLIGNIDWERESVAVDRFTPTMRDREVRAASNLGLGASDSLGEMSSFGDSQAREIERKFQELLDSPLGESLARIVEESYRMLPTMSEHALH
jgi:transcriptional regulator with XRE-family HTH domain